MNEVLQVYWIELLLFYALALGVVLLPIRWSLLCLLLAGCVEVIPPDFAAATSVGWENAVERLVLPVLFLLRMRGFRLPRIRWGFSSKAWAALVLYAALSALWSPFILSGFKMAAYLAAWFILYLIFDLAWHQGLLNQRIIIEALWGSLALACLQTYALGNPLWGTTVYFGPFASARFAPFIGPQSFGPFVACLLALLLFSWERRTLRSVSIGACLVALVLVGSRYALIEAGIVIIAWCFVSAQTTRSKQGVRVAPVLGTLLLAVAAFFGLRAVLAWMMPESRVNQLFQLAPESDATEEGTFGDRILIYGNVLAKLMDRTPTVLAFGSGTSSGGDIATEEHLGFVGDIDPNRTIHDEFLRAEYEWGVIGLGLGFALLTYSTLGLWRRAFQLQSRASYAALAIMPGILLALLVENPLAGPGTAESFGYLLVLTYGFTFGRLYTTRDAGKEGRALDQSRRPVQSQPGVSQPSPRPTSAW